MSKDIDDRVRGRLLVYINRDDDKTRFEPQAPVRVKDEDIDQEICSLPIAASALPVILPPPVMKKIEAYNRRGIMEFPVTFAKRDFEQLAREYLGIISQDDTIELEAIETGQAKGTEKEEEGD